MHEEVTAIAEPPRVMQVIDDIMALLFVLKGLPLPCHLINLASGVGVKNVLGFTTVLLLSKSAEPHVLE